MPISTIKEVAKACGLSVATVSRVLNNDPKVAEKTRKIVLETVEQMDYRPNLLGRNLRLGQSKMILIILSTITNNFHTKIVRTIEVEARKQGFNIMLCAMHDDNPTELAYIELLKNRMADGIIFLSTTLSPSQMAQLGQQYPIIQCCEYHEDIPVPAVSINNEQAAFDAVTHLVEQGCRHIAHITVSNQNISTRLRLAGYRRALATAGIAYQPSLVAYGRYGYRSAYQAMEGLLQLEQRPDGVFAISDRMAAGAIKCAIDHRVRLPQELAVVGFDNTDITPIYNPSISTVSQSQDKIGAAAMDILAKAIAGEPSCQILLFDHTLIVRDSSNRKPNTNIKK